MKTKTNYDFRDLRHIEVGSSPQGIKVIYSDGNSFEISHEVANTIKDILKKEK